MKIEKLLQIPIRRISQFDIDKNHDEIVALQEALKSVEKDLKNVTAYAIGYLKKLIQKYGKDFPRKTRIKAIEEIDRRAIETKQIKVGYDPEGGYVGTKVTGPVVFECTNFDKLLIFYKDGTYMIGNIPEKQFVEKVAWITIADKKTAMNVVYRNKETKHSWAKRFVVDKFILEKTYRYLDENGELEYFSAYPEPTLALHFGAAGKKTKKELFPFKDVPIKGAQTKGIRIAKHQIKKIEPV